MQTQRLEYFVALAAERNFVQAAEKLFLSQPSLSQQIKRLEEELGVEVIDRSVRPWQLTVAGKIVLEKSSAILRHVAELKSLISQLEHQASGRIRVATVPSALTGRFPKLIREFKRSYPSSAVSVEPVNTAAARQLLVESEVDFAVVLEEFDAVGVTSVPLYEHRMVLALPIDHHLVKEPTITLPMLENEVLCITPQTAQSSDHQRIIEAYEQHGVSPHELLFVGDYTRQVGLVAAGICLAIVPEDLSDNSRKDVVFAPLKGVDLNTVTHLAWKPALQSPEVKDFLAFLLHYTNASRPK